MLERFLNVPFIPDRRVTLLAIDGRCNGQYTGYPNLVAQLNSRQIRTIEVPPCPDLYWAIAGHPDIQFHPVDGKTIVIAPNAAPGLAGNFLAEGFTVIEGQKKLEIKYPHDVAYNVARLGNRAFHNLEAIDPVLKEELIKRGVKLIHIPQGYSKCAALILADHFLITEDVVLSRKAQEEGINTLLIESGFVKLPTLNYGFLGGAGGLIDQKVIAVTGKITPSNSFLNIINYLKEASCSLDMLSPEIVLDVGSLIPLKQLG